MRYFNVDAIDSKGRGVFTVAWDKPHDPNEVDLRELIEGDDTAEIVEFYDAGDDYEFAYYLAGK